MNKVTILGFILLLTTSAYAADIFTVKDFREIHDAYCNQSCPIWDENCKINNATYQTCIEENDVCTTYQKYLEQDMEDAEEQDFEKEEFEACRDFCLEQIEEEEKSEFFLKYNIECTNSAADIEVPVYTRNGKPFEQTKSDFSEQSIFCFDEAQKENASKGERYTTALQHFTSCVGDDEGKGSDEYCINARQIMTDLEDSDNVNYQYFVCFEKCSHQKIEHNSNADIIESGLLSSQLQCIYDDEFHYEMSQDTEEELGDIFTFGQFRDRKEKYCPAGCPAGDELCIKNSNDFLECIETNDDCASHLQEMTNIDDDKQFDWDSFNQCWESCNLGKDDTSDFFYTYHYLCEQTIADEKTPVFDSDNDDWTVEQYTDNQATCEQQAGEYKQGQRYKNKKSQYNECITQGTEYCFHANEELNKLSKSEEVPFPSMVCQLLCEPNNTDVQSGLFDSQYQCLLDLEQDLEYKPSKESEEEQDGEDDQDDGEDDQDDGEDQGFTFGKFRELKSKQCPAGCPAGDSDCLENTETLSDCIETNDACETYHKEMTEIDDKKAFDLDSFTECWAACNQAPENSNADILVSEFFQEYHFECVETVANQKTPEFDYDGKDAWTTKQYLDQTKSCNAQAKEEKQGERYNESKKVYDQCQKGTTYCINAGNLVKQLDLEEQGAAEVPYETMVCQVMCKPDEEADVQSGLFNSQYQCYTELGAELEYTPTQESEDEEVEEVFTFGNFRDNKEKFCPSSCPHSDKQCSDDIKMFRDCTKQNTLCKVYNEEIQVADNETQFDLQAFEQCWEECELTDDVSDFFKEYHYDCEVQVANQKDPKFNFDGDAWTTQQFLDNQDSCQEQANEHKQGKRYQTKKEKYDDCQGGQTYCINAEQETKELNSDEEGKAEVPFASMVCQLLCEPDNTEEKSGLFDSQYQCYLDVSSDLEYTPSKESEEEEDGEDIFTYGEFRNNKSQFCSPSCPTNDDTCRSAKKGYLQCKESNAACKVHLEEMQQRKDDEKFDFDSFHDCHKACEQEVDNKFYQTYSYECENTVAQGKTPQFFESSDDSWTTLQFHENKEECQTAADNEHRGKRYSDDKKAYKTCQFDTTEYCINANKLVDEQLINDEDEDVPYAAMVCQLLCEPQDGENKSGLFEAQYQCLLDKDTELEYKATKKSEEEDSYEDDGEDDDVEPSEDTIDVDLGQFQAINFKSDKDVFTLKTIIDTTSKSLRSLSVNIEFPSLFNGIEFGLKIGKTSYDKDILDLDLESRHSQSLLEKPIQFSQIQDFDCDGQEVCEGLLTIKLSKKHDSINKSNIEAVVQFLQEQDKENSTHQNGPILLDLSSNDSKLSAASQRYEQFQFSKFLFKIHDKTVEGKERFFHISEDLGSGSKFLMLQKSYNDEPLELDEWDSQSEEEIKEKVEDKHYTQQVLDKCENSKGCWYAITIYLYNEDKKQNAFYVGTTVPQSIQNSDKSITVSSNINKNQFMSAFRLPSLHTNGVLTVDISPVENTDKNADVLNEYQVDQWLNNKPLTNEHISLVGSFQPSNDNDLQFATVSPIDGDYFIFYYYGHITEDESINLGINQKEKRFVQLTSSDFITLEISPENQEATLFENVHIASHSNDKNDYKFSMKLAKDSKISNDDVLIQTSVIDYKSGALVPEFDSSKSKPWGSMDIDDKGIISYEVNLKENEKCAQGDGCQLFINFSFKSGKTIPKFHIDVKRDVAEQDKIPLNEGQFREIQLTNDFPSEYMLLNMNLENESFDEYHIIGKNFEQEDLEYYVSINGKKTDEKAKLLKPLNTVPAQTLESFTMQELTELCNKKSLRILADTEEEDDGEDQIKPDDEDDDDEEEEDKGCEIKVEIQKAKGSTTEFAKGSTTATVQYLKENADKDGNRIYGPVFLPPYNNDKTHMQTVTETYSTKSVKNADLPSYIKYHFKIVAIRGQRKIVNLMQTTRDGSQFYLQGADGTKFPNETEENLNKYFELEDDMSTARYAFKECDKDACEYSVTLYIKLGGKSIDTNSFYIEAQDYKVYFSTLGQQKSWQTNPRKNQVMQSYKKVNIDEDAQFSINIIEDLATLEKRRFLKDEPEDDDEEEKTEKEDDDEEETEGDDEDDDDEQEENLDQGTYVVCFFDYDTVRDGHNLRVIDTFKTGYPVGIMKPIDTYFVFYYSHSMDSVKYDVIYNESSDDTPLYTELKEDKDTSVEFSQNETTHFLHYQIKHLATSLVTLEMNFEKSDNKKPLDNLHAQVQTYANTQRNNIFPTAHQQHYGVEDFDGEGVKDTTLGANWKLKNQELGCADGCNMLFRFNHSGVSHTEPLKFNIKTIETVLEPKPLPGSDLGLILGLTFGGLVIVALGAFLFIRQQRKKQQSHLDYQDIEYQDKETKVSKFEEEEEDED